MMDNMVLQGDKLSKAEWFHYQHRIFLRIDGIWFLQRVGLVHDDFDTVHPTLHIIRLIDTQEPYLQNILEDIYQHELKEAE